MKPNINQIIRRVGAIAWAVTLAVSLGACNDKVGINTDSIEFNVDYLSFEQAGGSQTVSVISDVPMSRLTASVVNGAWCTAEFENGKLVVTAQPNGNSLDRNTIVKVTGDNVMQVLTVMQQSRKLVLKPEDGIFDYLSIFTDHTCSELKPGVTENEINNISSQFFRALALEIYNGSYDSEFRAQNYKPWQNPNIMSTINKTAKYSKRDNPTGIFALKGEQIVFFASPRTSNFLAYAVVQNPDNNIQGSTYTVLQGLNQFTAQHSGLIYIEYLTDNADEDPIKINFVTGSVNGYLDIAKHAPADWAAALEKAEFRHFDLLGERAHLTFETEMFRKYTTDGAELARIYDQIVYIQQDFMGLFKYEREFKNRLYFLVADSDMHMYATDYYTGYSAGTQSSILDIAKIKTTDIWGPAHEAGHVNQTRPGLRWHGMTEVTNNIFSLAVQTALGNRSRLLTQSPTYEEAKRTIIDGGLAHNAVSDPFCKLVPFWQLKLYLVDACGQTDFYRDLFEQIRVRPNPNLYGAAQLNFVKLACEVSGLDLTDFFTVWGFLTPIDEYITDYSEQKYVVSQAMIDAALAEIAAMNLPKPAHNNIYDITDDNVNSFK